MRLQPAAPRAHTALPVSIKAASTTLRRRLANLLTLSLLSAPALTGQALADEPAEAVAPAASAAETAAADAEGVVTLSDVHRTNADAAVRPAGLLGCPDDRCEESCAPACEGCVCDGACDGSCGPSGCLLGGRRGSGYGYAGCPSCPGGVCPPGIPCPGAGLLAGGVPVPFVPGLCLPGAGPLGVPHLLGRCGGPQSCYLCSLAAIGANANNGRRGLIGKYEHVYALNPDHRDRRTGDVWASQQTGVPMAVPLAPNVRHTMEYGWGFPSSRLVPISRPLPPSALYGPPAGTQVELPFTPTTNAAHPGATVNLPFLPEHGQGRLGRTGVGFPRTPDNAARR